MECIDNRISKGLERIATLSSSRVEAFTRNALQTDLTRIMIGSKPLFSYLQRIKLQMGGCTFSTLLKILINTQHTGEGDSIKMLRLAYVRALTQTINLRVLRDATPDTFENM